MDTTHGTEEPMRKTHPGRLTLYHANPRGTGAALQLELRLNRDGEDRYDCFFLEMAQQKTLSTATEGTRTPATFDWGAKVTVKLGFSDICEFLAVLEGKQEQAGGQRNGLYHEVEGANTLIAFKKRTDPSGFLLGLSRKDSKGAQIFKGHMLLSEVEGIGLRCLFQAGLFHMVYHRSLVGSLT